MSFDKFVKNLSEDQKKELLIVLKESTDTKAAPKLVPKIEDGSFTTSIQKKQTEGETFGVPVTEMPRFNKFEDDGSDHKDKQNATPDVELTDCFFKDRNSNNPDLPFNPDGLFIMTRDGTFKRITTDMEQYALDAYYER